MKSVERTVEEMWRQYGTVVRMAQAPIEKRIATDDRSRRRHDTTWVEDEGEGGALLFVLRARMRAPSRSRITCGTTRRESPKYVGRGSARVGPREGGRLERGGGGY